MKQRNKPLEPFKAPKLLNTPVEPQNANLTRSRTSQRRIYVIRRDGSGWTPIIEVISGPKSPALSTMIKRFETLHHKPERTSASRMSGYTLAALVQADFDYERNLEDMGYAGDCVAEWFLDWLLKTDARFERVEFQEVSL